MLIQEIRITHRTSVPKWMADAGDDFRIFADRVRESGNIRLMSRFGIVCRHLLFFLDCPDPLREFMLRKVICSLDEARSQTSLSGVALPVALWIILSAKKRETAVSASRVLVPTAISVAYVRIRGQA